MNMTENWIWLPEDKYPESQVTRYSCFDHTKLNNFAVADFKKIYEFDKKIKNVQIRFCGDTEYHLYCNGKLISVGPVCQSGEFIENEVPLETYYSSAMDYEVNSSKLDFYAVVKMKPTMIWQYSQGHGGFMLAGTAYFEDGTSTDFNTDETWLVRFDGRYIEYENYDSGIAPHEYVNAQITKNIWNTLTAPIPQRTEELLFAQGSDNIVLAPHEQKHMTVEYDKIYTGYVYMSTRGDGRVSARIISRELEDHVRQERITLVGNDEHRAFSMHSVGNLVIDVSNESDSESVVSIGIVTMYYPIKNSGETKTSDSELNDVLDVCKHTLKYCRQTHHLDSPKHCEPLACTGDYYIESLMTMFSFGDMGLAEFDIIRTADMLKAHNGRMFHTTYSLIWVRMLWDVYMVTGHKELLERCADALDILMNRFKGYIGDNGLIENSPDFIFVDWIYVDEMSMHHPPKCLGQTVMNMFYYNALVYADKVYAELGDKVKSMDCKTGAETLKKAVNDNLFDKEKGIYFEGLNTPSPEKFIKEDFLPQNIDKRYYLKHSSILAAYTGVSEKPEELIDKIMNDECPGEYQPYFAHYLFEAIYKNGMRDKYTLKLAEKWKPAVKECNKGLVEGFVTPEPGYIFDHSHAWGGTPLYSVPKAIMGLEIKEPGMKTIEISPSLLGLDYAKTQLVTEYGNVTVELEKGKKPIITFPKEINVIIRDN